MAILYVCRDANIDDPLMSVIQSIKQDIAVRTAREINEKRWSETSGVSIDFSDNEGIVEARFEGSVPLIVEMLSRLYQYGLAPCLTVDVKPEETAELANLIAPMKWKELLVTESWTAAISSPTDKQCIIIHMEEGFVRRSWLVEDHHKAIDQAKKMAAIMKFGTDDSLLVEIPADHLAGESERILTIDGRDFEQKEGGHSEELLRAAAERDPELAGLVDKHLHQKNAGNGGCSHPSDNGGCSCSENRSGSPCQCNKEIKIPGMLYEDLGNGEMQLTMGNVRVAWERIGEGRSGDYNPDDPEDEELLRFSVYKKDDDGNWQQENGASYCTFFPVEGVTDSQKIVALKTVLAEVYEPLIAGSSIKSMCEVLSYISPEWLKDKEVYAELNAI